MKRIWKISIIVIMTTVVYVAVRMISFDDDAEKFTQTYLNKEVSHHNTAQLKKISADKHTYHFLKDANHITLKFTADNQGYQNYAYYPVRINHSKTFWVTLKFNPNPIDTLILNHFSMIKIQYFKQDNNR